MEIKESNLKKWTGTYKGVYFEINNWQRPPNIIDPNEKDCWTYYIYLHLNRIPEENNPNSYWLKGRKDKNRVYYDYYKHPVLPNLEWHGGITWYSKERGFDGTEKIIKIGCDYGHSWDEGRYYNLDIVKQDVKRTIETFLEHVPNYNPCKNKKKLKKEIKENIKYLLVPEAAADKEIVDFYSDAFYSLFKKYCN